MIYNSQIVNKVAKMVIYIPVIWMYPKGSYVAVC